MGFIPNVYLTHQINVYMSLFLKSSKSCNNICLNSLIAPNYYFKIFKFIFLFSIFFTQKLAFADANFPEFFIESKPQSELWLNPGMLSYHFDKDNGYNNKNLGFGAEYVFSSVASITGGGFKNSDHEHSNYLGIYYHPVAIGFFKVGFVAGGLSGYPATNNGGWFPALIPTISAESRWVGANLLLIPSVGDKVHGAISLQLKFKVWDGSYRRD